MANLDQDTLAALERFRVDVAALPNESAKTHRFHALVAELFPGSEVSTRLAGGVEKVVRVPDGRRRIDSYHGNAVIEFERSLDVSLEVAVNQLRDQAAGLWNGEESPERGLLCIASDGVRWETYQARLTAESPGPFGPADVHLEPLQSLRLSPEGLSAFWLWLTGLLFRDQQVLPTTERFRLDFGSLSPAFLDGFTRLRRAWAAVGGDGEARVAFGAWRRYLTVTYGGLADSGREEAVARDRGPVPQAHVSGHDRPLARLVVPVQGTRRARAGPRHRRRPERRRTSSAAGSRTSSSPTSSSGPSSRAPPRSSPRRGRGPWR